MAEWIVAGNPEKYDAINAFRDLKIIDWTQSANIQAGDIVYIYVSGNVKALVFKCKANKVDIKVPTIEDQKYNVSGEFDGHSGRYMELEMLEEYSGAAYTRTELLKHGFKSPRGPVLMPGAVKAYLESVSASNNAKKKYSVIESVWIAAALLTMEQYENASGLTEANCYFKQSAIVHRAESLTENSVDSARVSWWCCADQEKSTNNYLRGDNSADPTLRRLARFDEYAEKTHPTDLNMRDTLQMNGRSITMKELFDFVENTYPTVFKNKTDIDYIAVLDYLEHNREIPYSNPDAPGITDAEKARLLQVKQKGQEAVSYLEKMAALCASSFGLDKCLNIPWIDGSNTKTRKYLWVQMKYSDYAADPTSISIFVEMKNAADACYRISLEINNDGIDKATMSRYHSHLDIPLKNASGLVYVSGSNEWGRPEPLTGSQADLKARIDKGELRKVQVCRFIDKMPNQTNEYFEKEFIEAVQALLPYYNHVLGKAAPANAAEYWPSLEEYNPGITKEIWLEILKDTSVTFKENFEMFKMMLELGGESTRANLAEKYGGTHSYYNALGRAFSERVHKKTGCPLCKDEKRTRYYTVPFVGRHVIENGKSRYSWKLRDELKEALEEMDLSGISTAINTHIVPVEFDKNIILYGPPGTGKTYNSIVYAVAICDEISLSDVQAQDYDVTFRRYEELKEEGRISFTTFHQSYGYEEFIEGIKPVVDDAEASIGYTIEPGVFKRFCSAASTPKKTEIAHTAKVWNVRSRAGDADINFDYVDFLYKTGSIIVEDITDVNRQCNFVKKMSVGDWVVLGREYSITAIGIVTGYEPEEINQGPFHWRLAVDWLAQDLNVPFADIGKSGMCVSNFAVAKSKLKPEDFIRLVQPTDFEAKPHVFIIDEINRGNISKIFGELITLIEDTKRKGMDEEASAILPYSGELFSVPSNVYIIGTMNTADRSIALMDTALRRRFRFVEMMPNADVLRTIGADKVEDLDVAAMLETINERITFLYDREHTIGHAFFTKLAKEPDIIALRAIFEKSIIPLLQEYFYEDYQKIQLVLGDNGKSDSATKFILDEEVKVKDIFKGNADDVIDLPEKKYTVNHEAFSNIESYKQIM